MCPRHSRFGDLPGSISQFLILNTPLQPHRKAFPGSKSVILIPSALPDGLPGSILALLSPNTPFAPHSKPLPGSKSVILIPSALPDGLPGSISAFLSPQPLSGDACSDCRSGAGARSTQCCRGQRQAAGTPALRLRLSLHKVRLRRPLRPLPLSGAGAKPARTCQPCALRTGAALLAYLTVGCP